MHHERTDSEIVVLVIGGETEAFGDLMSRYEDKLLRYVIYLIHDQARAADVVQDTFIKAYQNLNGFKPKYKFSSWIYRIAHNEAINAIKKDRHLQHEPAIEELKEASYESTIVRDIDRAILKNDMQLCLNQLDAKYREVLMLQYYENMKYSEIADVLHVPTATVGVWASRAKQKLRQLCEQKGVTHE